MEHRVFDHAAGCQTDNDGSDHHGLFPAAAIREARQGMREGGIRIGSVGILMTWKWGLQKSDVPCAILAKQRERLSSVNSRG
jgi:hypothetical protein